jgi:hypothetical protein
VRVEGGDDDAQMIKDFRWSKALSESRLWVTPLVDISGVEIWETCFVFDGMDFGAWEELD